MEHEDVLIGKGHGGRIEGYEEEEEKEGPIREGSRHEYKGDLKDDLEDKTGANWSDSASTSQLEHTQIVSSHDEAA